MKTRYFISKAAELNSDIELSIAKIVMKNKIKDMNICIKENKNGFRSVYFNDVPLFERHIEDNIDLLETLENSI